MAPGALGTLGDETRVGLPTSSPTSRQLLASRDLVPFVWQASAQAFSHYPQERLRGSGKQLSCASLCRRWRAAIVLPLSLRAPLGSTSILKVGPWSRETQGDSRGEVRLGLELGFESRSSGGAGRVGPEPACASWFPPQAGSPGVCRRPREGNKCVLFFFK